MIADMVTQPTHAELLRRFYGREPLQDGVFVVGVLSTGIYCLPSCTARKPKPENVRFFGDEQGAKGAGLRACKRCRPDRFYRGHDPDLEAASRLAGSVRRDPGAFPDVGAMAEAAGTGATKLNALFRRAYHTTPATYLVRARVERAAALLEEGRGSVLEAGLAAGFESASTFHEQFPRRMGLAPGAYRDLARGDGFELRLPVGFRSQALFALFGRDPDGLSERITGSVAAKALWLADRPGRVELHFHDESVRVQVKMRGRVPRRAWYEAHRAAVRMLGLVVDPGPFERHVQRRGHGRLTRGRRGLRIPLTVDVFEGLLWVIVGQQVNLTFASLCRTRVIEYAGAPAGDGFVAPPKPATVAGIDATELLAMQFSRRKAEYLTDTAAAIAQGELDLVELEHAPADRVAARLLAVRGLGPWSVQYLLMRAFAFEDCVPVGDAGLVAALERYCELPARPDVKGTLACMEPFAPHRSLACYHLWQSLGDPA